MEEIAVILLTYERTEYAVRTLRAAAHFLKYDRLTFYLADDGSRPAHLETLLGEAETLKLNLCGHHSLKQGTYGENANKALRIAYARTRLAFFLEDDWELTAPFDLYRYAALLMEREDVGMVRCGYLNLNMRGQVFGHSGSLYWLLDRECDPYVFTGHPSLRHKRFHADYGEYQIGLTPGETELAYAVQFRTGQGCGIVYPAALGEASPFGHIGQIKSY